MIFSIGVDIIEIERIKKACENESFFNKTFTKDEIKQSNKKWESLAGYFAAKEALAKAFGTGFRAFRPIDVEISKNELGKADIILHNNAKAFFEKNELKKIHLSISHSKDNAIAYVLIEKF